MQDQIKCIPLTSSKCILLAYNHVPSLLPFLSKLLLHISSTEMPALFPNCMSSSFAITFVLSSSFLCQLPSFPSLLISTYLFKFLYFYTKQNKKHLTTDMLSSLTTN